jgi:hypothetical protein
MPATGRWSCQQGGSGLAATWMAGVGSDGLFMVCDLLWRIGPEPAYHDSEVVQSCYVDAGAVFKGYVWARAW